MLLGGCAVDEGRPIMRALRSLKNRGAETSSCLCCSSLIDVASADELQIAPEQRNTAQSHVHYLFIYLFSEKIRLLEHPCLVTIMLSIILKYCNAVVLVCTLYTLCLCLVVFFTFLYYFR